jgi:putative hydrolase of the HAD superfamily
MIKAILFDFGGVLVRTGDPTGRREWEARLGLPSGELVRVVHGSGAWIKAQRGLISPADYWKQVALNLGIPEDDLAQLQHDFFRDDQLDQTLVTLIDDLRQLGYKVGLLSNDTEQLRDKLARLGILTKFDAVVISAEIGVMKPDPDSYLAILTILGVQPAECIFIDDLLANIDGAVYLGIKGIHFQKNLDLRSVLLPMLGQSDP